MNIRSKIRFVCEMDWVEEGVTEQEYNDVVSRIDDFNEEAQKELAECISDIVSDGNVVISDFKHEFEITNDDMG